MDVKKLILSWSVAFIVTIIIAYVFHQVILLDFYEEHFIKGASIMHPKFIVLGYGILIGIMAYIYPYFYRGGMPLMEGIKFGMFMGFLWRGIYLLVEYGSGIIDSDSVIVDGAWHILEQAISGVIIALIYGSEIQFRKE